MTADEILKNLRSVKREARDKYNADIKGIFGSYSRGEGKSNSDIDILVDFYEGATLFDLTGLGIFLEQKLQCRVDIVSQRALRDEIKDDVYRYLVSI